MKKEVCEKCIYGQRIDSAMACHCNYYHSPIAVTNRTSCSHYMAKELEPYIKIEVLKKIEALRNCSEKPNGSLISRQDAIEAIATVTMSIHLSNVLCDKLLALPSADRPAGEWVRLEREENVYDLHGVPTWGVNYMCDKCGFITTAIQDHFGQYRWCPSCGEKKRGESHE